jgi:hypothetical protein
MAEKVNNANRAELLTASADSINRAVTQFCSMRDIGPNHPEVGDCFSLLARTYLVARLYEDARAALREAYEFGTAEWPKRSSGPAYLNG